MLVPIGELTKKARAEFLPVPALHMKSELSSPEAARVRYWLVPLTFVNAFFAAPAVFCSQLKLGHIKESILQRIGLIPVREMRRSFLASPLIFDRSRRPHFSRMAQVVKTNKPLHPVAIGTFRAQTVMFHPQDIPHLLEQLFGLARGNRRRYDCP